MKLLIAKVPLANGEVQPGDIIEVLPDSQMVCAPAYELVQIGADPKLGRLDMHVPPGERLPKSMLRVHRPHVYTDMTEGGGMAQHKYLARYYWDGTTIKDKTDAT